MTLLNSYILSLTEIQLFLLILYIDIFFFLQIVPLSCILIHIFPHIKKKNNAKYILFTYIISTPPPK